MGIITASYSIGDEATYDRHIKYYFITHRPPVKQWGRPGVYNWSLNSLLYGMRKIKMDAEQARQNTSAYFRARLLL